MMERISAPAREGNVPGLKPYARAVLRGETDRVRAAQEGTRNCVLASASTKVGRFVPHEIPTEIASEELLDAALYAGLSLREARGTIRSGLRAGGKNPKYLEDGLRLPKVPDLRHIERLERELQALIGARELATVAVRHPYLAESVLPPHLISALFDRVGEHLIEEHPPTFHHHLKECVVVEVSGPVAGSHLRLARFPYAQEPDWNKSITRNISELCTLTHPRVAQTLSSSCRSSLRLL